MHPRYLDSLRMGVSLELELLSAHEKLAYMDQQDELNLPDKLLLVTFINALISLLNSMPPTDPLYTAAQTKFYTYLQYLYSLSPLDKQALNLIGQAAPQPEISHQLALLDALTIPEGMIQRIEFLAAHNKTEQVTTLLLHLLKENPACLDAACILLEWELQHNICDHPWLCRVQCPPLLRESWHIHLFMHAAQAGLTELALAQWKGISEARRLPYRRILAADMYALAGDLTSAVRNYALATAQAPQILPARLRLHALTHPRMPDPSLLFSQSTVICLYSWNKAAMLEQTLRALAATRTGNIPVLVLLNGCTDDSAARVQALEPLFNGRLRRIELPVNVGAPAARNWLIHEARALRAEFVAFLDDDVTLGADWLEHYLTLMVSDPAIGIVGGKILHPDPGPQCPKVQYTYRDISLFLPGLFKLSIATPGLNVRDTGLYTFTRECLSVMGCAHLLRVSALRDTGNFDIRFSPSQLDDIEHDLQCCLDGYRVIYCGEVTCFHHQASGINTTNRHSQASFGSIIGNDIKMTYKLEEHKDRLLACSQHMRQRVLQGALG